MNGQRPQSSTSVKSVHRGSNHHDSTTAINTAMNGIAINKPYNRYGWFLDSDEAEYEEEQLPRYKELRRETKWLEMTKDDRKWNKFVVNKFDTVKWRCRKGIPHSVRGKAWFYLCGGHKCLKRDPDGFEKLLSMAGDSNVMDEITKDLHRQFPNHYLFADGDGTRSDHGRTSSPTSINSHWSSTGQSSLYKLLKAYSIIKPTVGYCQGQAPIACTLLMVMPLEHAFWSFLSINDLYLVGYFDHGLESIQLHGDMLMSFIKRYYTGVYKLLKKFSIEPVLFMTEWFMCLYTRTLPWPLVLRIWDMFMCEGIIVIFKVAILLVGTIISGERKHCTDMYTTLTLLKNIPDKYLVKMKRNGVLNDKSSDKSLDRSKNNFYYPLLDKLIKIDLTEHDLKREHAIQANERRIKKKQAEDNKKASAQNKAADATDHSIKSNGATPIHANGTTPNGTTVVTPTSNGTHANGTAPTGNGTISKNGTMNGHHRPSSSMSRSSHRHRRAPFIEFEFSLGGKVLTNKPEYKPVAYGNVSNGGQVSSGNSFVDGPSRTMVQQTVPSTPRADRNRKSTSRSPSKERTMSIDRNKRSGSTRSRGQRESVSPKKDRSKTEGSPLRTRKSDRGHSRSSHEDRSEHHNEPIGHRTDHRGRSESYGSQTQHQSGHRRSDSNPVQDYSPGQLTVGQYNRSSRTSNNRDRDNHSKSSRVADHREPEPLPPTESGRSSSTAQSVHTHFVRDTIEGVPREVVVDGVHDNLCRSPSKPSKEVIVPIMIESGYDERRRHQRQLEDNGRSRSRTSGYIPPITDGRSSKDGAGGRSSVASHSNGRALEVVSGRTSNAGGDNGRTSATDSRHRTSTPLSSHTSVSRTSPTMATNDNRAKYTIIDHSKVEKVFHEEKIIYPVFSTEKLIPIKIEGSSTNNKSREGSHRNSNGRASGLSRSEERQVEMPSSRPRYEGSRTKFGARDTEDENAFRPFSRSFSGTNNSYNSTMINKSTSSKFVH